MHFENDSTRTVRLQQRQSGAFAVQSDGTGGFQINLTPETADIGTTTVVATAGATCSATAVYVVSATAATAPAASATPTSSSRVAGGPPRTDTSGTGGVPQPAVPLAGYILAIMLIALGAAGLLATKRSARR